MLRRLAARGPAALEQLAAARRQGVTACSASCARPFSDDATTPVGGSGQDWRKWAESQLDDAEEASTSASGSGEAAPAVARRRRAGVDAVAELLEARAATSGAPGLPTELVKVTPREHDGFAELASATETVRGRPTTRADETSPRRLLPARLFYPGQLYSPADFDPYARPTTGQTGALGASAGTRPPAAAVSTRPAKRGAVAEAAAAVDFRDAQYLARFLTQTGHLVPRSKTGLQAKLHRRVARAVKTARQMAMIPVDGRPSKPQGRRNRND